MPDYARGLTETFTRFYARFESSIGHLMLKECRIHGLCKHIIESQGRGKTKRVRCYLCNYKRQLRSNVKAKEFLVKELGGKCKLCGYNKYLGALEFHHLDPTIKMFDVGKGLRKFSLSKCLEEIRTCVLLCSNCHKEVEGGIVKI